MSSWAPDEFVFSPQARGRLGPGAPGSVELERETSRACWGRREVGGVKSPFLRRRDGELEAPRSRRRPFLPRRGGEADQTSPAARKGPSSKGEGGEAAPRAGEPALPALAGSPHACGCGSLWLCVLLPHLAGARMSVGACCACAVRVLSCARFACFACRSDTRSPRSPSRAPYWVGRMRSLRTPCSGPDLIPLVRLPGPATWSLVKVLPRAAAA